MTPPAVTASFRDIPVDVLRGLAIAIMVAANLVPSLLLPPAPFLLRLLSSVAAPLFIFISGMMVALSCGRKDYPFSYFLVRGGIVAGIAAALDLFARGMVPFVGADVLYLIGLSLPLAYLVLRAGPRLRLPVVASVLLAAPLLQYAFGYGELPLQLPAVPFPSSPSCEGIFRQWLIEGWFPLFPWLAVSLLGAHAGTLRWTGGRVRSFARPEIVCIACGLLASGAVLWYLMPGAMYVRYGYVELFYPPTVGFVLAVIGLIFALFIAADLLPVSCRWSGPLRAMGECSLAIYILHSVIIEVFGRYVSPVPLPLFGAGYLLLIGGMIGVAYSLRYLRKRVKTRSTLLRMLIGG